MTVKRPEKSSAWFEPESAANENTQPEYPFNQGIFTESGHSLELDDTPDRERIRLQHRSGTFIEMHPNGDEVHKVYGDGYEITIKNKNVLIKGDCNITIEGNANIDIQGDKIEKISGDYKLLIGGEFSTKIAGKANFLSDKKMRVGSENTFGGRVQIVSGGSLDIEADLNVHGEITADKIVSQTRVDAGTGMSAGPLGFVTITGGVSVGFPVAIPANIVCNGLINATVSVAAPLGRFAVMTSIYMTDLVNTTIYSTHIHIAPLGPTSPPIINMV